MFELLSLTPRPWIDPETLQSRFLALAAISHPDARQPGEPKVAGFPGSPDAGGASDSSGAGTLASASIERGAPVDFAELNTAKRVLEDPVQRVKHVLELEAPELLGVLHPMTHFPEIQEQFMVVATLLREVSVFRNQQSASLSALQRAVLKAENASFQRDLEKALSHLDRQWTRCETQIQGLDCVWERRTAEMLRELALIHREMTFLQKWRVQLREARLQLEL